jgi:hypothetical protein
LKRYRLLPNLWIDTRRNIYKSQPKAIWGRLAEDEGLPEEFGQRGFEAKLERFVEMSPPWARLIWPKLRAEHEVYDAYAFGAFYPALASVCCLGEALLNELVSRLARYFKHTPGYKTVYRKEWIQDWPLMINLLKSWGILDPLRVDQLSKLYVLRKESVHLRVLENVDEKAKEALQLYSDTVSHLFGPSENLVFWCPGEMYLRRERGSDPLIREFFLGSCPYVGYKHRVEGDLTGLRFVDDHEYENRVISDQEFRQLRICWTSPKTAS